MDAKYFFDDSLAKITPRAFSVHHYVEFGMDEMRFEFRETISDGGARWLLAGAELCFATGGILDVSRHRYIM